MLRRPGGLRARRPRHPRDRALLRCLCIVSFPADASPRPPGADQRQRAAGGDGRPDVASVPERPGLPAPRPPPARPPVSLPAVAVALQRALPGAGAEAGAALEGTRRGDSSGPATKLRLLDTTPLPCGQSIETTRRSQLAPWAGFGYCPAHSRRYWGFKLVLLCAPDGTIVDFDLVAANAAEREAALALLEANPIEGATIICDKGFAGADFEAAVARAARTAAEAEQRRRARPAQPADRLDPATDRVDRQQPQRPTPARTPRRPHPRRPAHPSHRTHPRPLRRHQPQPTPRPPQPRTHRLRRLTALFKTATTSRTAPAESFSIFFSAAESFSFTISSMPALPSLTGTPM